MNKKIMTWSTYEAPKVQTLDVLSEGVLCGSYGDANQAGRVLQENDDNSWNFGF